MDHGMARQAVAFDYSHDLLAQAEQQRGDRPITYFQADCNRIELEPDSFDLVVNVAALHHVQYLDRLCRIVCRATRQDGVFVNYDYIGPSRNQYAWRHWLQIRRANRGLPPSIRKPRLRRPHLATMLATDPTEAVHSAMIPAVVARYFDIVERHDTGGGIAYELLTHNPRLGTVPPAERDRHVERLLALDREATRTGRVPPLFTYFIARPKRSVLQHEVRLRGWQQEEAERERRAAVRGGVYSDAQYVELLLQRAVIGVALRVALRVAATLGLRRFKRK
jgi:SAM-dependent methyltransferase